MESCCQCFSRLVESFSSNRVVLKQVVTTALLQNLQQLVSMRVISLLPSGSREVPYSVLILVLHLVSLVPRLFFPLPPKSLGTRLTSCMILPLLFPSYPSCSPLPLMHNPSLSPLQLVVSPPVISSNTFVTVLRMMSTISSACPALAVELLKISQYLLTCVTVEPL